MLDVKLSWALLVGAVCILGFVGVPIATSQPLPMLEVVYCCTAGCRSHRHDWQDRRYTVVYLLLQYKKYMACWAAVQPSSGPGYRSQEGQSHFVHTRPIRMDSTPIIFPCPGWLFGRTKPVHGTFHLRRSLRSGYRSSRLSLFLNLVTTFDAANSSAAADFRLERPATWSSSTISCWNSCSQDDL